MGVANPSQLDFQGTVVIDAGKDRNGVPLTAERLLDVTVLREREFYLWATSLKPNTQHWLYVNGERISDSLVRPYDSRWTTPGGPITYGSPIISRKNGDLYFYFRYQTNTGVTSNSLSDVYYILSALSGRKHINVADVDVNTFTQNNSQANYNYNSLVEQVINSGATSFASYYIDFVGYDVDAQLKRNKVLSVR